jgi:Peptidase inhibitor I78 family
VRALLLATAVLALAGCGGGKRPAPPSDPALCDVKRLKVLVGRPASAVAAAEALQLSGARTIRWVGPDSAVTMDYRPDRLNVLLTGDKKVKRFTCG